MAPQLCFFLGIALALIAWWDAMTRYVWPRIRVMSPALALRPLLLLHTFRFLGLAFLVPGVVSAALPTAFAHAAAYGDLIAAMLALLALRLLPRRLGIVTTWVFNLWGSTDLVNAFYQADHAGLIPGQLGAAYFIPTFFVPLLLITHAFMFRILLVRQGESAITDNSSWELASGR